MEKYGNKSRRSGVEFYEIGKDFIKVRFVGNTDVYVYNRRKPGLPTVNKMKLFAVAGEGLSTFISQEVKDGYDHIE